MQPEIEKSNHMGEFFFNYYFSRYGKAKKKKKPPHTKKQHSGLVYLLDTKMH